MHDLSFKRLTVTISGRVQGVFFRRGVRDQAVSFSLTGYAKNLTNGSVEVVVEGDSSRLQSFLDWCYQGTRLSKVESLYFAWSDSANEFTTFSIVREGNYVQDKIRAFEHLSSRYLSGNHVPRHIVVIPDGNRRWARSNMLAVRRGHDKGFSNAVDLMSDAHKAGVKYFTLWGFSTENWNRSKAEVDHLMALFRKKLPQFSERFHQEHIAFKHFGRKDRLPKDVIQSLNQLEFDTQDYHDRHFGLALDYGGRDEILRSVKRLVDSGVEVSEETVTNSLDTRHFPDPDLIIRTSGEQRLSGIMPWQGVYAELYFAECLFPDFTVPEFQKALREFAFRKRRFGH
ncbi:MAG: di-trans,poly-cis-decaprenylcistransferase [Candidatus Harrisonbacteria bacterium CG10_big_fil_rev_8_21_14_0_10_42_17]|uniref:Isoprenyl transferase n=1 Tax=Candidatus Harrisonbacteria bacterium CG10_big_fil_rev_8_21_14_0_10_42_17 TaxID=1974584 RepID=A0A2M6WIS8_9BACT|nr:MAG: di-trans,poly-cis-decaprenylcistransferase [Candidatus Harrisonbacteria bacterium CG10_big_fil_rev_8_21_14_0_10_42_17]